MRLQVNIVENRKKENVLTYGFCRRPSSKALGGSSCWLPSRGITAKLFCMERMRREREQCEKESSERESSERERKQ